MTIQEITTKYKDKLDYLDLEILIAHSLGKTREFVLTYPEYKIPSLKIEKLKLKIARRAKGEPVAHLLGHKEFYGLDFIVNKHTLIPRPETELMVESVLNESENKGNISIIDIGTGSGCIIISIAHALRREKGIIFYATDISKEALKIAKKNAKNHSLDKKIKFLHGNLLSPFIENCKLKIENSTMIIVANLPYLSKEIYNSAPIDVKKFEPKTALYSKQAGLAHYQKLLRQIKKIIANENISSFVIFLEISPEQKSPLGKLVKDILPNAKTAFQKDLAGKWRICKIDIK